MDRQREKEQACHLAASLGFALFSRGHRLYAVMPDGRVSLVCGSRNPLELWSKGYLILSRGERFVAEPAGQKYRIRTPSGMFEAPTWYGLLANWLLGKHVLRPPVDER